MRVVITGIGGLLGSRLAKWILENISGCVVIGVDDWSCGFRENVPQGVETFSVTLGQTRLGFVEGADAVFHFAAHAAECLSPFMRVQSYRNNVLSTAAIVNWCVNQRVRRLVYASSIAVYGRGVAPFLEKDPTIPVDPYGNGKLACERDIMIAGEQHGLSYCILRLFNVYGPGQNIWDRHRNVLGIWMRALLEDRPLVVYGDGGQVRSFTYIDDILPAMWNAAVLPDAAGQIYNLGSSNPTAVNYAAEKLIDVAGRGSITHTSPRHEVDRAWCSTKKSAALGWTPKTYLTEGLEAMWEWAQAAWEKYPERRAPRPVNLESTRDTPSWV